MLFAATAFFVGVSLGAPKTTVSFGTDRGAGAFVAGPSKATGTTTTSDSSTAIQRGTASNGLASVPDFSERKSAQGNGVGNIPDVSKPLIGNGNAHIASIPDSEYRGRFVQGLGVSAVPDFSKRAMGLNVPTIPDLAPRKTAKIP